MTKSNPSTIAALELAAMLGEYHKGALTPFRIASNVEQLVKLARSLHRRYEAMCNYQWANTEAYERRTERLEARTVAIGEAIGVTVEHQRDPRGWPLIVRVPGNPEHRIG